MYNGPMHINEIPCITVVETGHAKCLDNKALGYWIMHAKCGGVGLSWCKIAREVDGRAVVSTIHGGLSQ